MAIWMNEAGDQFDDGLTARPGEEGFTREVAAKHFAGGAFNYVGTPNWISSPVAEPEAEVILAQPEGK